MANRSKAIQGDPSGPKVASACPCCVSMTRRGFLTHMFGTTLGVGLTALGAVGGLWAAAAVRFLFPNARSEPASRFFVGSVGDYRTDRVETRYKETHGVWIVREGGRIYALSAACTHLGCMTLWNDSRRRFMCPCHGSGFSVDGVNRQGPAPRPLERLAIRLDDNGLLQVDKSRVFRRELGQWDDAESFVSV